MNYQEKYLKYKNKYLELSSKYSSLLSEGGGTYKNNESCSICGKKFRWTIERGDNPAIQLYSESQDDSSLSYILDMNDVVELKNCKHVFHRKCIDKLVKDSKLICPFPNCNKPFLVTDYIKVTWSTEINSDFIVNRNQRLQLQNSFGIKS